MLLLVLSCALLLAKSVKTQCRGTYNYDHKNNRYHRASADQGSPSNIICDYYNNLPPGTIPGLYTNACPGPSNPGCNSFHCLSNFEGCKCPPGFSLIFNLSDDSGRVYCASLCYRTSNAQELVQCDKTLYFERTNCTIGPYVTQNACANVPNAGQFIALPNGKTYCAVTSEVAGLNPCPCNMAGLAVTMYDPVNGTMLNDTIPLTQTSCDTCPVACIDAVNPVQCCYIHQGFKLQSCDVSSSSSSSSSSESSCSSSSSSSSLSSLECSPRLRPRTRKEDSCSSTSTSSDCDTSSSLVTTTSNEDPDSFGVTSEESTSSEESSRSTSSSSSPEGDFGSSTSQESSDDDYAGFKGFAGASSS